MQHAACRMPHTPHTPHTHNAHLSVRTKWMTGWMSKWMREWVHDYSTERVNEWMNEWMDEWMQVMCCSLQSAKFQETCPKIAQEMCLSSEWSSVAPQSMQQCKRHWQDIAKSTLTIIHWLLHVVAIASSSWKFLELCDQNSPQQGDVMTNKLWDKCA